MIRKMKMLKSRKALSPVVASIILIAVTVAVSIAVAAWMGALTFTFTKTEELKIIGHTWLSNTQIRLTVKNTGASDLTISGAQVDDNAASFTVVASANLAKGDSANVTITKPTTTFTSGVKYNVAVLSAGGNKYLYQATYP
jgi:flagellin-like protein